MTDTVPRIAVIGAGIIGAAVARQLALHGARVWLLDRDDRADATSRISFAWVNAHRKREPRYHRLNVAGMAEHHVLARQLDPHRRWHFPTGHLEYATEPDHAARVEQDIRELRELDYPARRVDRAWAQAHEPWARIPDSAAILAFFPSEGFVLPGVLGDALIDHARALGVQVGLNAEVLRIVDRDSHVDVMAADGSALPVDRVVICAGRWTERLAAGLGLPVPLVAADGPTSAATAFQARTAPLPVDITGVVTTSVGNFRPDVGGRLVFQAHDLDDEADPNVVPPAHITAEMRSRLAAILRTGERGIEVDVESTIVGKRALPVDGVTIAGYVDERHAVYAVATHSGVTLGPLLGRLVAEELTGDRESPLLATFRPDRFAGRTDVPAVPKLLVQGGD
ncbi:MAG TPA: FAD-dependent oxidoreductase [Pseudonocardiaceae bacterium]|jgi:glycine/D-amino acid oxidase-like deaminating enzyme|nr:FAD-dependent oxidoreductase [Pseudonocardiaceae bacterium]